MKLLAFIILLIAFICYILIAGATHGYVDSNALEAARTEHYWMLLLVLFILALLFGILLFLIIRDTVKTKGIALRYTGCFIFIFFVSSLVSSRSFLVIYNKTMSGQVVRIHGKVFDRNFDRTGKNGKTYYLDMHDIDRNKNYYFQVSEYVYMRSYAGDIISKDFQTGRLGILYRKEK